MVNLVDCLNLTNRFEARLLTDRAPDEEEEVPAIILTGFLGSGKTTIVQHLLRNRCTVLCMHPQ